eukprot:8582957-Karenia_brevis.AAC.1
MRLGGAEVLVPTALDDFPQYRNLLFFPAYAKWVADETRQLRKVQRGKTPGSNGWMKTTEYLVRQFEKYAPRDSRRPGYHFPGNMCHEMHNKYLTEFNTYMDEKTNVSAKNAWSR